MKTINYFGTSLTSAGHYFWDLEGQNMYTSKIRYGETPFDPESMPRREKADLITKGDIQFISENGYSILAIEGSCIDNRLGTKSVFFINEMLSRQEFIELIKSIPAAMNIIEALKTKYKFDF